MKKLGSFLSLLLLTTATLIAMAVPAAAATAENILADYGVFIIVGAVAVIAIILFIVRKIGRKKPSEAIPDVKPDAAEETAPVAETVAEDVAPVAETVAENVAPVAETVAEDVAPVAKTVAEDVAPVAKTVEEDVAPVAETVAEDVAPVAETVAEDVAPVAETVAEDVAPVAETVAEEVKTPDTTPAKTVPEFADKVNEAVIKDTPKEAIDPETGCTYTFNEKGIPVPPEGKVIRYKWSFLARISQAHPDVKYNYLTLRRTMLAYNKMRSNVSWNFDSYFIGRKTVAKLKIRGKNLVCYFPIDPKEMEGTKYIGEDASKVSRYKAVPFAYSINGTRKLKYALELIERICGGKPDAEPELVAEEDVEKALPTEDFDTLYLRDLIKIGGFLSVGADVEASEDDD